MFCSKTLHGGREHICKNKGVDQLSGNSAADQHLGFCYIDGIIPLLPTSKVSSLLPSPELVSHLVGNPEDRFSHDMAQI